MVAEWHNGPWKLLPLMYSWSTPINISFWLSFLCRSKECEENEVSIGFVLKILWGTKISLDGDGGFRLGHSGAIITPYFWGFRNDFFRIQLYRKKCDPSILHTDCCKYLFKKKFVSGSRSQKILSPPASAPQHWISRSLIFQNPDFYWLVIFCYLRLCPSLTISVPKPDV